MAAAPQRADHIVATGSVRPDRLPVMQLMVHAEPAPLLHVA